MASKITIKRSLTAAAPAGLSFGEMAFVQGSGNTAEQLYVGISGGNPVWVGARVENTVTDWDSKTRLATQFATVAKINSLITSNTAGVASFNGLTGAITGVSSFNGLTGAVSGVTTSVANTFTALQTFSAGISASGGTFSGDIRTTQSTASIFSTTATTLNIGAAATTLTLGAMTGYAAIRNPQLILGGSTAGIFTDSEDGTSHLTIAPLGNLILSPIPSINVGGDNVVVTITNTDQATGQVQIEGGDLHLGNKINNIGVKSPVNIIFDGVTADANKTTLTVTDPTATRTITLPDATGTVALTATSVASFNGVTGAVTGVASFNGLTGAVSGLTSGGPLGTPLSGNLTNCTFPTLNQNTTGSAATLTTSRNINGTAFNGSADITVTAAANTLTGATLASNVLASSLTSVGTLLNLTVTNEISGDISGSAASSITAEQLLTARSINGVSFNGTANITVPADANTLTGTTLASNVVGSSLTRVGTISSGIWQGTAIGSAYVTTLNQNTTGSAATLTTSRNINGTAFNGSADITVTAAANTLTGATLASNVLASSLTSVGTLGSLSITGDLTVGGTFTVNGTVTTINSTTLTVDDKNIELGSVAVPDNTTAADGGITLKGATDKTLKWLNSGAFAWTSSENFDLVSTKAYYIAGASVLNATTLGTLVVNSSLTSVGTLTSLTVSGTLEAGLIDGGTF